MQPGAGLGLKPEHFSQALECQADGLWFEVHPENYAVDGGPRLERLLAVAARHPLALHGVSLSLAADAAPDPAWLRRLAALAELARPWLVSEHLAWSLWRGQYAPDLLPFPRSKAALARITDNVCRVQDALGRRIALENPSHYLSIEGHDFEETDFLAALVQHTGCGLLLDLNNVHVAARNLGYDAAAYLARFPVEAVMEIHLAGHREDDGGSGLLVDSHDAPVDDAVWQLYDTLIARIGPRPTLIERDDALPAFEVLLRERARAQQTLDAWALPA